MIFRGPISEFEMCNDNVFRFLKGSEDISTWQVMKMILYILCIHVSNVIIEQLLIFDHFWK